LSSVGGVEHSSTFAARCNTPFHQSLNSTGSSSSITNTKSESDIMPPLKEITLGSGSSEEEEGDGSETEEDWQSAGEEGGNLERAPVDSEGFGDETWELFSLSGVRHNSV
jgi:hypothetical protein